MIAQAYDEACRAMMTHRPELVEVISRAPDMALRHIVRATRSYSLLLTEFRQPARLRSGIARDDLLRSLWTRLADQPDESALIRSEEQALKRMDVPLFTTSLDSCSLRDCEGEVIPSRFEHSAREDALARLRELNATSVRDSVRLIQESVLAAMPAPAATVPSAASGSRPDVDPPTVFRRVAADQARVLVDSAILGAEDATWISVASSTDSSGLEYRPLGPTLYDGLAGILFATTYAHRVQPGAGLDELAARTAHSTREILTDWTQGRLTLPIGAFSGATGLLYALAHFDAEFDENRIVGLHAAALMRMREALDDDSYYDVMAGAAGAIAVLTSAPLSGMNTDSAAATVRALSHHLIDHAVLPSASTLAWETGTARARLGGFSHGATGIGWALARAARALGDAEIARVAVKALRFDDTLFDPTTRRWLDARPESLDQGQLHPTHWCHGSAGILMARASAARLLDDTSILGPDPDAPVPVTALPLPSDDSLCHGTLGNLLAAGDAGAVSELNAYRQAIAARLAASSPRSGLPEGITSVRGLMLGTAGTLYATSRQIDRSIPNVLLLE